MGLLASIANTVKGWLVGDDQAPKQATPAPTPTVIPQTQIQTPVSQPPIQAPQQQHLIPENLLDWAKANPSKIEELIAKNPRAAVLRDLIANSKPNGFDVKKISSPRIQVINDSVSTANQRIIELKLENGIRFVVAPDNSSNRVNLKAVYSVGSKDDKIPGTAHLLEHLLAGRTPYPSFAKGEDMDIVKYNGGYSNAATHHNFTFYDNFLPPELLELAFKIESERMRSANIDSIKDILPIEKATVTQEIKKYEDDITQVAYNALNSQIFQGNGYSHPVLGTEETLSRISIDELKQYYAQYSNPNNLTVVITGNISDPKKLEQLILNYFGNIPVTPLSDKSKNTQPVEFSKISSREHTITKAGDQKVLALGFEMPHVTDPDGLVMEALVYGLLQSSSPILGKKLNEDKKLGLDIGYAPILAHGRSALQLLFTSNKFTDLKAIKKEVKSILEDVAAKGLDEAQLAQLKQQCMINQYLKEENLELKSNELAILSPFQASKLAIERTAKIQKITNDDIKRVASKYLAKDNEFSVYIEPSEVKKADHETTQNFQKQEERVIDPIRMQELTDSICGKQAPSIPEMHIKKTSTNNHKIVCNENHRLPLTNLYIFTPRKALSTKEKLTMGILASMLSKSGTRSLNSDELQKSINNIGGNLSVISDADGFFFKIGSSTLGDNLKKYADLFKEFIMHNKLDMETFTKIKSGLKHSIKEENNNAESLVEREVLNTIYPKEHFRHEGKREERWETLDSISYADVIKFWEDLKNNTFTITASGDINQEQVEKHFGTTINDWVRSYNPNLKLDLPEAHAADIQELEGYEFKGEQEQAHIVLAQAVDINESHPDYYAVRLLNLILGGDPLSSRLGKIVRENSGLVYHIHSYIDNSIYQGGPFKIEAATKKSNAQKLMSKISEAIQGFPQNITDKEIMLAKQILIRSSLVNMFKDNRSKASTLLDLELKNRDMNFINNFANMINSINREQIIQAAKHLKLDQLHKGIVDDKLTINGQEIDTKFDAKAYKAKQANNNPLPQGAENKQYTTVA